MELLLNLQTKELIINFQVVVSSFWEVTEEVEQTCLIVLGQLSHREAAALHPAAYIFANLFSRFELLHPEQQRHQVSGYLSMTSRPWTTPSSQVLIGK